MTILNRKAIPFEVIFKEPIFLLFAVAEVYKYVDGEKTDEVIGLCKNSRQSLQDWAAIFVISQYLCRSCIQG